MKPIPFKPPMVRAIMREVAPKTVTRRIINPQPAKEATSPGNYSSSGTGPTNQWTWLSGDPRDCDTWGVLADFKLPYAVGDRLYVREPWRSESCLDALLPSQLDEKAMIYFEADGTAKLDDGFWGKVRPAMFLPKRFSRITLEVTDVTLERLQAIDEEEAIAEGIEMVRYEGTNPKYIKDYGWKDYRDHPHAVVPFASPRKSFESLWESIHGEGAWEANPWVAAYSFNVVKQ